MERLSSCYFCGDALDATLEEHPVVPSNLHPDPESQKSVVLCSSCRQKLEVVLETVVDAVERDTADETAVEGGDQPSESADGAPADDLEPTPGDDEEMFTSLDSDDGSTDDSDAEETADAAEASKMEFGDDRAASESSDAEDTDESGSSDRSEDTKYTDSRGAGFRRDDDGAVESGSLTGGAFSDDDSTEPTESRDQSGSSDSNDASSESSSSDQRDTGSGGDSDDPDGSTTERDISLSRLENTKVMRLLENREFPVDKDEFVTVAASAYQISREDCETVLALAVEHDLLREDDGQLYDGDA